MNDAEKVRALRIAIAPLLETRGDRRTLENMDLGQLQAAAHKLGVLDDTDVGGGIEAPTPPEQGQQHEAKEQGKGTNMSNYKATLAQAKGINAKPSRSAVTTEKLQRAVKEIITDSPQMQEALKEALRQRQGDLREDLGIDQDIQNLADAAAKDMQEQAQQQLDLLTQEIERVREEMTTTVEIRVPEISLAAELDDAHAAFPLLLANAVLGYPTMLVGPSGSGKTTAMRLLAEELDREFSYMAMGPTQVESKFSGWVNAVGEFIPTDFYLRYRYGGIMGIDEIDAAEPSVLVYINGTVQNRLGPFPRGYMGQYEYENFRIPELVAQGVEPRDFEPGVIPAGGMVEMHEDCFIVASANTYGKGADARYQGRNALDAATMKRFKIITWDYDERMEAQLCGNREWLNTVRAARRVVDNAGWNQAITPVDSMDGARMLAAGLSVTDVLKQTILAGMAEQDLEVLNRDNSYTKALAELRVQEKRAAQVQEQEAVGA